MSLSSSNRSGDGVLSLLSVSRCEFSVDERKMTCDRHGRTEKGFVQCTKEKKQMENWMREGDWVR
jgi:hypothetical protein